LTKFVDKIRGVGGTGIPLAGADGFPAPVTGVQHFSIDIGQYNDVLHSDFVTRGRLAHIRGFKGTKLWGYGQGGNFKHLGGIVLAQRNVPLQITFTNNLPGVSIIPNDATIPQPAAQRPDRVAIHLHGGHVHWMNDGGPHHWWAPDGTTGPSFMNNAIFNPTAAPGQAEYFYPNDQSGRLMWYHDHAWGITRTNAYAGLATAYVLIDPTAEAAFDAANPGVPSSLDLANLNASFHYLVFQDKIFFGRAGAPADYGANAGPGDLFYAYKYDQALFGPAGVPSFGEPLLSPPPVPSCVPEFFGDTILVNGTAYPRLDVEARPIRIRLLNACSSRFLNPRLVSTAGWFFPFSAEPLKNRLGPAIIQIGTEGGYLPKPVFLSGAAGSQLLLAPAERADIIIDFSNVQPGREFILYNDAPGPFPGGVGTFDFFPLNRLNPYTLPGFGPNTRTLLKIRVKAPKTPVVPLPATINTSIADLSDPLIVDQTPGVPTPIPGWVPPERIRTLTLNEGFDDYGRLGQFVGTDTELPELAGSGFYGRRYLDPVTENPQAGTVEVWQLANLTADTHPMHFHLANAQILYRQPIDIAFNGTLSPIGPPVAPDDNELGFKETVRMNPGEVTVIIMKFDLPANPPNVASIPDSPRTGGAEYVFHCHILEHEEHDMMRPLVVTP
jgi:spore coat protein A